MGFVVFGFVLFCKRLVEIAPQIELSGKEYSSEHSGKSFRLSLSIMKLNKLVSQNFLFFNGCNILPGKSMDGGAW